MIYADSNVKQYVCVNLWLVLKDAIEFKEELLLVPTSWNKFVELINAIDLALSWRAWGHKRNNNVP